MIKPIRVHESHHVHGEMQSLETPRNSKNFFCVASEQLKKKNSGQDANIVIDALHSICLVVDRVSCKKNIVKRSQTKSRWRKKRHNHQWCHRCRRVGWKQTKQMQKPSHQKRGSPHSTSDGHDMIVILVIGAIQIPSVHAVWRRAPVVTTRMKTNEKKKWTTKRTLSAQKVEAWREKT